MERKEEQLLDFMASKSDIVSYGEMVSAGFDKRLIRQSLTSGHINKIDRGLYRLAYGSNSSQPDLIAVTIKAPKGVLCLISALSFHEATLEIPHRVDLALPRGAHRNRIHYPPVRYFSYDQKSWEAGIEEHKIDGHVVKVYSLAKTVADCFKFRNKIGINIARDALKTAIYEKRVKPLDIANYARICRVDSIVNPLLEILLKWPAQAGPYIKVTNASALI